MRFAFILIVSVCLCYMGFYNGFPLVYPDTGSYMEMGFNNHVLLDRPITYGLFLRHISLHESLWLVIFVQAFLLAWCVYLVFKYFAGIKKFTAHYLLFFLTILLFTGVSVNVSQLIPDIFTSILILTFIVLFFAENVSRRDQVLAAFLFLVSIMMHNSHLVIIALFLLVLVAVSLYKKWKTRGKLFSPSKWGWAWGLTISGWLLLCTLHYSMGGRFEASGGSHVFLMNRLLETGILEDYLERECANKNYRLCEYRDKFPADFLWDYENSPLHKTGGWEANREEYSIIIKDILTQPRYFKLFLIRSIEASVCQFFVFNTGDTPKMVEGSPPYGTMHWFYRPLLRQYMASKQSLGLLNFDLVNFMQKIIIFCALFLIIIFWAYGLFEKKTRTLTMGILALVFCNACVCATFGGVFDRYQSRVVWLLVLPVFIAFTQTTIPKIKQLNTDSTN